MSKVATVTSKKQLTLPSEIFSKAGLKVGQKVLVSEENGRVIITPTEKLVNELAGSVSIPEKWKGKSTQDIIELARNEYYREKYSQK